MSQYEKRKIAVTELKILIKLKILTYGHKKDIILIENK